MSDQSNAPVAPAAQVVAAQESKEAAPSLSPQEPAIPKQVDEFSSRFAALTKREKQVQEERAKAKAEAERLAKYAELEKKAKEDPLAILTTYGIDLDTLLMASVGHQKAPPTVEEQLAELKAQLQKEKDDAKTAEENKRLEAEKAYQASIDEAILNHQNSITELLSKNKDKYELISHHGVEDLVWETTEAYFETHGKVLTPQDAADMVEEYLFQQTQKALELSKFKGKATPQEEQAPQAKQVVRETHINPVVKTSTPKTLTSNLMTVAPNKTSTEKLSAEESKRRAAEFLANAWKQKQ